MNNAISLFADVDLNGGQIFARFPNLPVAPTNPKAGQFYYNTTSEKVFLWGSNSWIDLSFFVASPMSIKGEISNAASAPGYPGTPGIGDVWLITSQAGTVGGVDVEIGDELVYSASGWFVLQRNLKQATQVLAGFVRFATDAEAQAGADSSLAISAATLAKTLSTGGYARKVRATFASLSANVATSITHGLGVANQEDIQVSCWQGGRPIFLDVAATSGNSITVQSNTTLGNVTVIIIG